MTGLAMNTAAVKKMLPDWKIRLYFRVVNNKILEEVLRFAMTNDIQMVNVEGSKNPMISRYSPFFDENIQTCVVRDLDSIMSVSDVNNIKNWMNSNYLAMCYKEYLQDQMSMGGGVALKVSEAQLCNIKYCSTDIDPEERGYDEDILDKIIGQISEKRVQTILTRCTINGSYYTYSQDAHPTTEKLLWTVPFPKMPYGTLPDIPSVDYMTNMLWHPPDSKVYHTRWVQ